MRAGGQGGAREGGRGGAGGGVVLAGSKQCLTRGAPKAGERAREGDTVSVRGDRAAASGAAPAPAESGGPAAPPPARPNPRRLSPWLSFLRIGPTPYPCPSAAR